MSGVHTCWVVVVVHAPALHLSAAPAVVASISVATAAGRPVVVITCNAPCSTSRAMAGERCRERTACRLLQHVVNGALGIPSLDAGQGLGRPRWSEWKEQEIDGSWRRGRHCNGLSWARPTFRRLKELEGGVLGVLQVTHVGPQGCRGVRWPAKDNLAAEANLESA